MVFPYPHPPPNIQLPPPLTSYLKLRGGTNETKRTHGPDGAQMIVLFIITDKNIFIGKDFGQKYLSKNIFFQNIIFQHLPPSDCLTQITPPLLSSSSVIFEVWVWHNKRNEGLTDRTEHTMIVPFIVLDLYRYQYSIELQIKILKSIMKSCSVQCIEDAIREHEWCSPHWSFNSSTSLNI